jgi:2-dehydropantoate 2-reductase
VVITDKKIAVLGTGSIGSSVGADLTHAGLDVTLIDQWPAHVEAMKANGLHIQFPDEDLKLPVAAWHLCELAEHVPEFDVVFLAVKSYDTVWMLQLMEPYLKDDGVVIGLQNAMNDERISSVVGVERTIGCVVELSAEIFTPGLVQRDTTRDRTWFGLGELDGAITPRLEMVKSIMENVAKITLTNNVEGGKWTKLIANCMTMGPIGLTGLKNIDARKLPGMFDIAVQLGREAMAVGDALGYELEPILGLTAEEFAGADDEVLIKAMETLMNIVGPASVTAPIHDHIKGRKSDMSYINGLVAEKGEEFGIPVTHNAAVAEIDRRINEHEIPMDDSNFGLLKSMVDSLPNRV